MKNIVYFDLETRRSAAQVGGWNEASKMGMSVGVTFSTKDNAYHIYTEDQVSDLINELCSADLVVGYNHIGFDYQVLQAFSFWSLVDRTHNLDICADLTTKLGHRLKLDSVASVTLGNSKTADGMDALKWWAEYEKSGDPQKMIDIARYCCFDVKVTMEVYRFGALNGYVNYVDKKGNIVRIDVDWKLDW